MPPTIKVEIMVRINKIIFKICLRHLCINLLLFLLVQIIISYSSLFIKPKYFYRVLSIKYRVKKKKRCRKNKIE
ncbi:MAG: hypothetical protein CO097_02210 [Candidatus Infernicultor aquiphilus]|uniref:Uncharacterized protein n=1 Tax=Candidatus Infernicultor aquiphilus TaxID=1805029 RepID=A0A2M8CES2_9BACT|nr:MAG: hypothetical protein CO097_02210 [Candidatus Atribacteria bacterium CG_4_9_14_3_um_filter_33_16]